MSAAKHKLLAFVWKSFPKTRREKARHCEAAPQSDGYCFSLSIWAFRQGTEPVSHSNYNLSALHGYCCKKPSAVWFVPKTNCDLSSTKFKEWAANAQRAELSNGFQGRVFKGNIWFECCSFWTFFWLLSIEVMVWCFGYLIHQPASSNQPAVCVPVVSI